MMKRKLFSNKETVIWCICIALAGLGIVGAYIMATSKSQIDSDVKEAHRLESHQVD